MTDEVQIERYRLQLGQARIYYQVAGAGQPVVLVHGLSGSTRWWARNIKPLAEHFRVYVIDLIGFGGSRASTRFVLSEAAIYLMRWLDVLGIEQVSLVGHSMGGLIATELAADVPDRVDHLVLVDAPVLPVRGGPLHGVLRLARAVRYMPPSFLPVLASDALRSGPATLLSASRQLLAADIRPKLAHIKAPTLIVWGQYDALVPPEVGWQLHQHLPQATHLIIPRAGHNPMWDAPDAFNQAVIKFLAVGHPAAISAAPGAGARAGGTPPARNG